jgi:hypothetical protein
MPMRALAHSDWLCLVQDLPTELKRSIGPMVVAEAAIWTPVQFLNFRLLPAQHQQMFVNVMSIVEAAVLSWRVLPLFCCVAVRHVSTVAMNAHCSVVSCTLRGCHVLAGSWHRSHVLPHNCALPRLL